MEQNSDLEKKFDVIVAGGGPAGLSAACLLNEQGVKTAIISPFFPKKAPKGFRDPRTIAMMQPSVRLMEHLKLWPDVLEKCSSPLLKLRLLDDSGHSFDGSDVTFSSEELSNEPFGWNVPLPELSLALLDKARSLGVEFITDEALSCPSRGDEIHVNTKKHGKFIAKAVIAADGRNSNLRKSAGIAVAKWSYDQFAIGAVFKHSGPHHDMSTECHKQDGPITTVPMPDNHSSLVWMVRPERKDHLMSLDDDAFATEIQRELHGSLGVISDVTDRKAFPMEGMNAMTYGKNRVFLIGEAAHVVPPIGAQGLNMSLRDGAMAAELIGDALAFNEDIGSDSVLEKYDTARRRDVWPRQKAIDLMNRTLLSDMPAIHDLRAIGLKLVDKIKPLRDKVMHEGIAPETNLPRIMQN